MKSIDFPKANVALAKDQPQYQTLFVYMDKTGNDPNGEVTCCFELTDEEIAEIVRTKKAWFTQVTFGRGYAPVRMSFASPFVPEDSEATSPPMDENRTPADVWDKTHYAGTKGIIFPGQGFIVVGPCKNCGAEEQEHFWSSRQCQK